MKKRLVCSQITLKKCRKLKNQDQILQRFGLIEANFGILIELTISKV